MLAQNVKDILEKIGYTNLSTVGDWYRTKPLYRDSKNFTSLSIHKETGHWSDFGNDTSGSLEELIKLTTGEDVNGLKLQRSEKRRGKIVFEESVSKHELSIVDSLVPDHSYWVNRNVSYSIIKRFGGGVCKVSCKMKDRYVFPIQNPLTGKIMALSGRSLYSKEQLEKYGIPKWKHIGKTSHSLYPLNINKEHILGAKELILVESIGDMLSLASAGIKNSLVCFGIKLPREMMKFCIGSMLDKIIIAFNNDEKQNGYEGAKKTYYTLSKYIDREKIKICLPKGMNDFGDMNRNEILNWKKMT